MLKRQQMYRAKGFTLIELLISTAITSIIMVLLLGLMEQSTSTYRDSQSAVNILSESRSFFQFFEADLASRLPNSAIMSEISATSSDKIAFIRAQSFDEQISTTEGDLRTSLYYVAFTADLKGAVSPKLFRRTLNPVDTQTLMESSPTPAIPIGQPASDEPVIYNVVNFKVSPKQYSTSGQLEAWTSTSGKAPALIEVNLDLTDDFVASRYKTEVSWAQLRDPTSKEARRFVRNYTKTIRLSQ